MAARRRNAGYSDSRRYSDWIARASEDLSCAMLLLREDDCYNCIAFHCQQAIEKALKAYILIKSNQLVDGHNLTWLCKQAVKYNQSFQVWLADSAALNKCYIETRYPADMPPVLSYEMVRRYFQMARDMYTFICAEMDTLYTLNRVPPEQLTY